MAGRIALAPALLMSSTMLGLDLVYQYRMLLGKCESGLGLEVEEILELTALEAVLSPDGHATPDERATRRDRVELTCRLRGHADLNDTVRVTELGPSGLVCRQTPYVDEGAVVEVVLDDPDALVSYRFTASVTWLREDVGDDFAIGLTFVGAPLLVHYGPVHHEEDAVDRIAAERATEKIAA